MVLLNTNVIHLYGFLQVFVLLPLSESEYFINPRGEIIFVTDIQIKCKYV